MPNAFINIENNCSVKVHNGNEKLFVDTGSRTTLINDKDTAEFFNRREDYIESSGQLVNITKGEIHKVLDGGQNVTLTQGNQLINVSKNRIMRINGDLKENLNDNHTLNVEKSTKLKFKSPVKDTFESPYENITDKLVTNNFKLGLKETVKGLTKYTHESSFKNEVTGSYNLKVNGCTELSSNSKIKFEAPEIRFCAPMIRQDSPHNKVNADAKWDWIGGLKVDFYFVSFYQRLVEAKLNGSAITGYGLKSDFGLVKTELCATESKNDVADSEVSLGPLTLLVGVFQGIRSAIRIRL
ncbi:hypothetical protein [Taylorella asinigenitalis]|uniref:hypothetical protein n=1 Tax=Taylorella asinigenitalis TaxID=84590 RepID=UPI00048F4594|nr:hypothetical protein [Taylorella asinigenitalis]